MSETHSLVKTFGLLPVLRGAGRAHSWRSFGACHHAPSARTHGGGAEKFQTDPHWRDYVLFYEYLHGDNGAGLGASHQTGWTALAAKLIQQSGGSGE